MKSINPSEAISKLPQDHLRIAQSLHKVINGNIEFATPIGKDSTGIYNAFDTANTSSVFIRIGAHTSTETYKWAAANTGLAIKHNLGRQPIGFRVVDADANANIYRTVPPDADQITLAASIDTVNITVEIF